MQVSEVIRKYRKEKHLTQEEMAKRLGVTAPAVNKWESGSSLPDVALLSPIARLLGISTDVLLSHDKEISDLEVNLLVEQASARLRNEPFDEAFQWMKKCLEEYPNSHILTLLMAQVFSSHRQMNDLVSDEKYGNYFFNCYKRALESDDEKIRSISAESLYFFYLEKEDYDKAIECLDYFSIENPERKRKQALIYSKTNRKEEAYKMYEELLYVGFQNLSLSFQNIYQLTLEENDFTKAHMLAEKMELLANLSEFGEYHGIASKLELATLEKDEKETIHIMERMIASFESIFGFTKSQLYTHMEFQAANEDFLKSIRDDLLKTFSDEITYAYLKDNPKWKELVSLEN